MAEIIKAAPFTDEQVKKLNEYQKSGEFHPYTCNRDFPECEVVRNKEASHRGLSKRDYTKDGILIATPDGWVCPCGKYKQNWCYSFNFNK